MNILPAKLRKLSGFLILGMLLLPLCSHGFYSQPKLPELSAQLPAYPENVLEHTDALLNKAKLDNNFQLQMQALYLRANAYQVLGDQDGLKLSTKNGLEIARQINDTGYISSFLLLEAEILDIKGDWRRANSNLENAIALARTTDDERLVGEALLSRSSILTHQDKTEAALKDLMEASEIFRRHNDKKLIGITLSDIALIYQRSGEARKAIAYFHESMKYDEADDLYTAVINHINLGTAYTDAGEPVLAEKHLDQAIETASRIDGETYLNYAMLRMGDLKFEQQKFVEAQELYKQALGYFILKQDTLMEFNTRLSLADTHVKLQNAESARMQIDEASVLADSLGIPRLKLELMDSLADYYLLEGRPGSAVETLKNQLKLTKEAHEKEQKQKLDELKIRFEMAQSAAEAELMTLKISEQQTRHNLSLAIIVLVVLLFSIALFGYLKQRSMNKKLAALAMIDELTGVANRRHIITLARNELDRTKRYNSSLVLAIIDLDHFKQINDRFGHHMGDKVLKLFAKLCHDNIRKPDNIGRIGGEEWLLVFPSATQNQVLSIIERIRELYASAHPEGLPKDHPLTFCAGISQYLPADKEIEDIILRADSAQYEAKTTGRDRVICDNIVQITQKATDTLNESLKQR